MTSKEFGKILQDKLTSEYCVELNVASNQQIYRSLALICRQMMSENHKKFQSKAIGTGTKQVYYLCMEFLMGRSLKMSLFNLGLDEVAKKALADADINLDSIFEEEPDAGLGNGGLGRLAACYLDGMATTDICGTGYSILYEYGIFRSALPARSTRTGTTASTTSSTPTTTALWPFPPICMCRATMERALQSCVCGRQRPRTLICPASLWATTTLL